MHPLLFLSILLLGCQQQLTELTRTDHQITGQNGISLHVRILESGSVTAKEPLVMVHGGGPGATSSFDLPVSGGSFAQDLVEKGFKVYLMNIRGWEHSSLPNYDFSDSTLVVGSHEEAIEDIQAVVDWVLKQEGRSKVNLFGWATGGHWICAYATKYPNTVNRLISLNSLYGVNAPWNLRRFFASSIDSTSFNKTGFFRESPQANLTRSWSRTIPVEDKSKWRGPAIEAAYRKYASGFGVDTTVMWVPGGYREESFYMSLGKKYWDAKDIVNPSLIIRTELDFWSRPEDLTAIQKELVNAPGSRFVTIPGTHYVFLDRPAYGRDQLIEEVTRFLDQ